MCVCNDWCFQSFCSIWGEREREREIEGERRVRTPLLLNAKLIAPIIHGESCLVAAFGGRDPDRSPSFLIGCPVE